MAIVKLTIKMIDEEDADNLIAVMKRLGGTLSDYIEEVYGEDE